MMVREIARMPAVDRLPPGTAEVAAAVEPSIQRPAEAADGDGPGREQKNIIGHTSGQISAMPLPLSRIPRTMRRKWVTGSTSPIHCAHTGMPWKGKAKPESRIDGRKKKNVICIACIWFWAMVEKV